MHPMNIGNQPEPIKRNLSAAFDAVEERRGWACLTPQKNYEHGPTTIWDLTSPSPQPQTSPQPQPRPQPQPQPQPSQAKATAKPTSLAKAKALFKAEVKAETNSAAPEARAKAEAECKAETADWSMETLCDAFAAADVEATSAAAPLDHTYHGVTGTVKKAWCLSPYRHREKLYNAMRAWKS